MEGFAKGSPPQALEGHSVLACRFLHPNNSPGTPHTHRSPTDSLSFPSLPPSPRSLLSTQSLSQTHVPLHHLPANSPNLSVPSPVPLFPDLCVTLPVPSPPSLWSQLGSALVLSPSFLFCLQCLTSSLSPSWPQRGLPASKSDPPQPCSQPSRGSPCHPSF